MQDIAETKVLTKCNFLVCHVWPDSVAKHAKDLHSVSLRGIETCISTQNLDSECATRLHVIPSHYREHLSEDSVPQKFPMRKS